MLTTCGELPCLYPPPSVPLYPVSVIPVGITQDSVHTELVKFTHTFKMTSAETVFVWCTISL